jgi:hypothetical protein
MTAPVARIPGRLSGPALGMLLAIAVLLIPVGYLGMKVWNANNVSVDAVDHERAAATFGRPLVRLMALLVDARSTAVEKITIEDFEIQNALKEINGLDRSVAGHLGTDQRLNELATEINNAVTSNISGSDAVRVYATPIALAQDLLEYVLGSAHAVQDESATFHLLEVALRQIPQTIAAAGQLSADVASGDSKLANQIQLGIGQDRVQKLADTVSTQLRGSTGHHEATQFATDLRILKPLDTFSAAANELTQASAELSEANATGVTRTQIKERADTASNVLRTSAVELSHALLDAFDGQLRSAANTFAKQRWFLTGVGLVILAAIAALMWLRFPWPPPRRRIPEAEPKKSGRHNLRDDLEVRSDNGPRLDGRGLPTRESTNLGRAVGARKR